jgi:hypothetical protein
LDRRGREQRLTLSSHLTRPSSFVALAFAGLVCGGCHKAATANPPFEAFKPGEWRAPRGTIIGAPPAANRAWRVLMLQEQPRPKKNPHWQTIPVGASGNIEMPAGSHFRCIYNPVTFRTWDDEHLTGPTKWDLLRTVRCSSDGWATYSQAIHVVSMNPSGSQVTPRSDQTELGLHDVIDGHDVQITIALRGD